MNVDAIYVISLTTATERQRLIRSWYPPEANLQFFLVIRAKNPAQGCFESHQRVLALAKEKGYRRILVLEDDAFPRYPWKDIVAKTNQALGELEKYSNGKWEILAPGYVPFRTKQTDMNNILKVISTIGTHAYLINVPELQIQKWNNIPIDLFYFNNKKSPYTKVYATYDILFEQKFNESQINFNTTDYSMNILPKFYGGIENMRNVSNTCNTNILLPFIITLISILFVTIIVWKTIGYKSGGCCLGISTLVIIIFLFYLFLP